MTWAYALSGAVALALLVYLVALTSCTWHAVPWEGASEGVRVGCSLSDLGCSSRSNLGIHVAETLIVLANTGSLKRSVCFFLLS